MPDLEIPEAIKNQMQQSNSGFRLLDIQGKLATIPSSLTNLENTLMIAAHGSPYGGFTPDPTSTNKLANLIRSRFEDKGEEGTLTLKEIADVVGPVTNDVKRVIIDACFAAGYTFQDVKKLFPNLNQLVSPSVSIPTSASNTEDLVQNQRKSVQNVSPKISPFFSITETDTNRIERAKDWLKSPELQKVQVPLSSLEVDRRKELGLRPNPWRGPNAIQYSGSNAGLELNELLRSQKSELASAKSREEIDMIEQKYKTLRQAIYTKYNLN